MIKAPNWQPNAVPTPRGWVYKGELIKSQKISEADIAAYNNGTTTMLTEAPSNKSMDNMSERELHELTSHHDMEEADKKDSLWGRIKHTLSE